MNLVYGRDAELAAWAEPIARSRFRDDARAIGVEYAGDVVASFVYDTFSATGCFMHVAMSRRFREWRPADLREVFTPIFALPFIQCRYPRISCVIAESNRPSLRFATWLGCRREGVMREAAPGGEDLVLLGMLARECRWLPAGVSDGIGL